MNLSERIDKLEKDINGNNLSPETTFAEKAFEYAKINSRSKLEKKIIDYVKTNQPCRLVYYHCHTKSSSSAKSEHTKLTNYLNHRGGLKIKNCILKLEKEGKINCVNSNHGRFYFIDKNTKVLNYFSTVKTKNKTITQAKNDKALEKKIIDYVKINQPCRLVYSVNKNSSSDETIKEYTNFTGFLNTKTTERILRCVNQLKQKNKIKSEKIGKIGLKKYSIVKTNKEKELETMNNMPEQFYNKTSDELLKESISGMVKQHWDRQYSARKINAELKIENIEKQLKIKEKELSKLMPIAEQYDALKKEVSDNYATANKLGADILLLKETIKNQDEKIKEQRIKIEKEREVSKGLQEIINKHKVEAEDLSEYIAVQDKEIEKLKTQIEEQNTNPIMDIFTGAIERLKKLLPSYNGKTDKVERFVKNKVNGVIDDVEVFF